MMDAGFASSEEENFKDRMWNAGNDGKTIKADSTLEGLVVLLPPCIYERV